MDPKETPGHVRFRAWKGARSNSAVAARLHVDPSRVSRWLSGGGRPDLPQIVLLSRIAKIPPAAWLTDPERAALTGGRAAK